MTDVKIPEDRAAAFVPHNITEPILGSGSGPLAGKTFAVKDLYHIAGRKLSNGNPDYYDWVEPKTETSVAVQQLLDAGADIVGITICDEFFYSLSGDNAHYGAPKNLRAPGRMPGGSSSGSAAAMTAEMCDFTLGSDTGGSVRVPASFCGLYGIRPTHGRVDLSNAHPMAPSFDTAGWFTNDAALFRDIGPVLLGGNKTAGDINRMLVLTDAFDRATPEVRAALEAVLAAAAEVLPAGEPTTVAGDDTLDVWWDAFRVIQASEVKQTNVPWVEEHNANLGPGIRDRFAMAAAITAEETQAANNVRDRVRERMSGLATPGTIMCLPTAPVIAPPLDAGADDLEFFRANTMALTCISGHSGLPQVTVPAANVDGCPIGLSFIGWHGGDEALLNLAVALQPFCTR
ncbi:MAG: amidase [Rhodospirillaceae bacterium]|jgi:amidase|nr:amidase [Rhodospirillaceae bacterium]MBT5359699.1 amidase [Rhodospirillaceae bacterium]MBT5945822.1 amidase [Rhodospirillaceae bacterium]MBT6403354.1 amidase [Rhodospirillaceae bacterium]